jgi:hypothetical protein
MRRILSPLFIGIGIVLFLTGCRAKYSFTGASLSPDIKTVSIQYFSNNAPIAKSTLSQTFTEGLKNVFSTRTDLAFVKDNGDIQFEGSITDYRTQPMAVQANETAAYNQLIITIQVKFTNTKDEKQSFESSFSQFAKYPSSENFSSVEDRLIKEISDQLIEDIFNKSVSNW